MPNTMAYGFTTLRDVMSKRVSQVGVETVWEAVRQSIEVYTRVVNELMNQWVERTVTVQELYRLPSGGTLQPLDEIAKPRVMKLGQSYTVGYPIKSAGTAWGTTRVSKEMMTVDEVNEYVLTAQRQDADWLRRHLIAAVIDNESYSFTDEYLGAVTVYPLANGDSIRYINNVGEAITATHYQAQAAAIADATNPFPAIYDALVRFPSNGVSEANPIVTYVASSLRTTIQALAAFEERPAWFVEQGSASSRLSEGLERYVGFGDRLLGAVNDQLIVEWSSLPAGYMVSHATGAGRFVKMREYDAPNLQGFYPETHSPDGALQEYRLIRHAGMGVSNRVAAFVTLIGSGSYDEPAAYKTPLAV